MIAIITGLFGVLGILLNRTRQHSKGARVAAEATREQVENDHTTNLRDDNDEKHRELVDMFATLSKRVDDGFHGVRADVRGQNREIGRLKDEQSNLGRKIEKLDERIDDIERTVPSK